LGHLTLAWSFKYGCERRETFEEWNLSERLRFANTSLSHKTSGVLSLDVWYNFCLNHSNGDSGTGSGREIQGKGVFKLPNEFKNLTKETRDEDLLDKRWL